MSARTPRLHLARTTRSAALGAALAFALVAMSVAPSASAAAAHPDRASVRAEPAVAPRPAAPTDPTQPPGNYTQENIAADRTSANFFYRIPALTHLGDGVVLAAWDARPGSAADAPNPNSIMLRRSLDNGATWSEQTIIAAGNTGIGKYGYSDPSFVVDRTNGRVFAFFVYSKDQGFGGSAWGNDDADRQVISAAVIQSDDQGVTWSEPRLITDVVKPSTGTPNAPAVGDVKGTFATSGEGIQLRYGAYAGRLIQQFAGVVRQANGQTAMQAYSVYSDDSGATWQRGAFVGVGMDENKVVELSDGTVMLNSRDSDDGRLRKIAFSTDGGATYGAVTRDVELPDPTNNASLFRLYPDAPQGSAEARMLAFVNSNNGANRDRINGAVRVSCDDGQTWPGLRTIEPGGFAYASATPLDDGRIGVLWEANYTNDMRFSSFDVAWLAAACAPLAVDSTEVTPGVASPVNVTVTNQEARALTGTVTIEVPAGWSAAPVALPALAPGASTTVQVHVTAPAGATGSNRATARFTTADARESGAVVALRVAGTPALGVTLTETVTSPARDVEETPYEPGDTIAYRLDVTSTAGVVTTVTPDATNFTSGFAPTACRWRNLAAGGSFACQTPRVTLTEADIARGWFAPQYAFTVQAADASVPAELIERVGDRVALRAIEETPQPTPEPTPDPSPAPAPTEAGPSGAGVESGVAPSATEHRGAGATTERADAAVARDSLPRTGAVIQAPLVLGAAALLALAGVLAWRRRRA